MWMGGVYRRCSEDMGLGAMGGEFRCGWEEFRCGWEEFRC